MVFFKFFSSFDLFCNIKMILFFVDEILFKNVEGVICVLKYCKDVEKFVKNFEGMLLFLI